MENLISYITSVLILTLIPGPGLIFLVIQGLTKGKKESLLTVLGLCSGCLVHTIIAAFGIAIIIKKYPFAYYLLKYLGILFLFYLAYSTYKSANDTHVSRTEPSKSGYISGLLISLLDPEIIMLYLTFMPQFIPAGTNKIALYMLLLGFIFAFTALVIFSCFAILSAQINHLFLENKKLMSGINKISAAILFLLAVIIFFMSQQ